MAMRKTLIFTSVVLALAILAWGVGDGWAQPPEVTNKIAAKRLENAARAEAAARAKKLGLKPGAAAFAAQLPDPGGVPHYFGPYGNWAFSPLPSGPVAVVTLVDGGTGYSPTPTVTIDDAYLPGVSWTFSVTATAGVVDPITTLPAGSPNFMAPVVTITDSTGTGAIADATIAGTLTGGMRKFVDKVALLGPAGANTIGQYIPVAVADITTYTGSDYYEIALVEYTERMHSDLPPTRMRGYVQIVPQGWTGTDILGNSYSAVALTTANGLTQNITIGGVPAYGASKPHYLGPVIVAKGRAHGVASPAGDPKPARIKFYNLLPTGAGGNLFIPVDETVPGSGLGPALPGGAGDKYTQNRAAVHLHGNNTVWISDGNVHQWITPANETTPYPAGVSARNVPDMPGCASDAANPQLPGSSGCMTLFYTNAQSARLQFYHDHALGITRLNVYAGEAAGYVITDAVEQDMIDGTNVSGIYGIDASGNPIPGTYQKVLPGIGIPLVIQDKTFVDASTIYAQDPTWNWGTTPGAGVTGDLWYPHVYMTVQNPWDLTGTNAFGRWHYGPWFNPPVPECVNGAPVGCIDVGPVPNVYYDPVSAPWEPPMRPGVPNPSIPGESFLDTAMVNGTAYPYLEVEPKAYRFRILNAANDRMFNLQLYVAADKTAPTTPGTTGTLLCDPTSPTPSPGPVTNCTEVKMVPVSVAPANQYADTPSGIPDPATAGPPWIMIGTEGGFKPAPVVVPQQPVGYNLDPAFFNFGVVNQHSLWLGPAERADVIVDFSAFANQTLILYNDSPAPVPAGAAPYDFYTGSPNQMDAGGAPTTQPGYGPNTRTIMQIRVGSAVTTPTTDVTLANLQTVFAKTAAKRGVFEVSQDPIIMPQAAFSSAYNNPAFPATSTQQYVQVADTQKTFQPINDNGVLQPAVTMPLEMKAMHDEMGGVYDTMFGRMSGMLGLSNPLSPIHVLIPYGLASPPTDLVKGSIEGTPIGVLPDGTQIWRIFHNGVDTHPIHVHLFTAQLINRIGQDGQWYDPAQVDPIDLGWKETFKVNPLEITYLALRPTVPTPAQLPFEVQDSVRLIDPTLPEGATLIPPAPAGWFDPAGLAIPEILNHYVNFGWEYVWHCHILSHEEMDMMHALVNAVPPRAPTNLIATWNGSTGGNRRVTLNWSDQSIKEAGFTIQRATNDAFTAGLTTFNVAASTLPVPSTVVYVDTTVANNTKYWYRVFANGAPVGDLGTPGFPTMAADSVPITADVTVGTVSATIAAPTNLTATLQAGPQVSLAWRDNATNETGFSVERCTGAACTGFARIAIAPPRNNTGNTSYVDTTVTPGNTYRYQVAAINSAGSSAYAGPTDNVIVPAIPAAPTNFTVTNSPTPVNGPNTTVTLVWQHPGGANLTNFTIQRATNLSFTANLATFTPAAAATSLTQTVRDNTTYYYRIRANNSISGSSAWTNALPFPIRTGN
jgi:FtsP/CotA-like multicopper oxidase with cupredoxin domain